MNNAIITTSWDDGHPSDFKLVKLLQKYDVPATFYIPINNVERQGMTPQGIREIAQSFDIGGHAWHHVNLTHISPEEAETEIVDSKKRLEEIIGREVLSFCYPDGKFDDKVINLVKQAGFIGGRTTKLFTRSLNDTFKMGTMVYVKDLWFVNNLKRSAAALDPGLFYFLLKKNLFFEGWNRIAIETLNFVIENGGVWHLWGHSWEIDSNNDWGRLKEVLCQISMLRREVLKVDNSQLLRIWYGNRQEERLE